MAGSFAEGEAPAHQQHGHMTAEGSTARGMTRSLYCAPVPRRSAPSIQIFFGQPSALSPAPASTANLESQPPPRSTLLMLCCNVQPSLSGTQQLRVAAHSPPRQTNRSASEDAQVAATLALQQSCTVRGAMKLNVRPEACIARSHEAQEDRALTHRPRPRSLQSLSPPRQSCESELLRRYRSQRLQ